MVELLKDFLPIFLSGYISLTFFRYRQNQGFARLNGEKYIIELFMWGFISHFSFLIAKYAIVEEWKFFKPQIHSETFNLIFKFLYYTVAGTFFGCILSNNNIYHRIKKENSRFKENKFPVSSNHMEEEFVDAIYFKPTIYIFEISNGKFYIGVLKDADIDDSTPFEEKILKFVPIKSGHRDNEKKTVEYDTHYFDEEKFNLLLNGQLNDNQLDEYVVFLNKTPPVTVFLRELISYRKFNPSLQQKFHS